MNNIKTLSDLPAATQRNNVIMTLKRRHKRRFDIIMTLLLHCVPVGLVVTDAIYSTQIWALEVWFR